MAIPAGILTSALNDTPSFSTVPSKHVYSADDEKGEVIAAVLDSRGYITLENGEVKRQTLYGSVRIEQIPR